jgi:hypothetical protein
VTWLVEQRLPIILLGASATLIAAMIVIQTRRIGAIVGLVGVVLLTIGLLVLEAVVVTEVEEIEFSLHAIAAAVERNDLPAALAMFPDDATSVRHRAEGLLGQFTFSRARIENDLRIEFDSEAKPRTARAEFTCNAKAKHRTELIPYEFIRRKVTISLIWQDDRWALSDYEIHNR